MVMFIAEGVVRADISNTCKYVTPNVMSEDLGANNLDG